MLELESRVAEGVTKGPSISDVECLDNGDDDDDNDVDGNDDNDFDDLVEAVVEFLKGSVLGPSPKKRSAIPCPLRASGGQLMSATYLMPRRNHCRSTPPRLNIFVHAAKATTLFRRMHSAGD